jgi:hypothetical protein
MSGYDCRADLKVRSYDIRQLPTFTHSQLPTFTYS